MNDIQQVVDELRFLVQRDVVENSDELKELLAGYSAACVEVNERLRKCDSLLKRGLRSEALQLADAKPSLLDQVAVLDFPERKEFIDIVGLYFLTPPQPLLFDVAAAINAAYAEHEPIKRLLDQHRIMALARAPLNERLSVLRSIAEIDATTEHWENDVREMERARFHQIDSESLAAFKAGNSTVLKSLMAEVQATSWLESVPAALNRDLKVRSGQAVRGNAKQRLTELSEQLHTAFSALDAQAARPLRDEWNQNQKLASLSDTDPLAEGVAPILDWLDDEDRKDADARAFTRLTAEIEQALHDEEYSLEELNKLHFSIERLGKSLPPLLESRLRNRLGTLDLQERRKSMMKFGIWGGSAAIVASILGFVAYMSVSHEQTRRLAEAASNLIEDGNLDEARKLIEKDGNKSTAESWLAVKKKFSEAEQAERDRVTNWKAQVATARESTDTATIGESIKQARELSKTAEEKIEVGHLQAGWQKRVNEIATERDRVFREAAASATAALKSLEAELDPAKRADVETLRPLVEKLDAQMAKFMPLQSTVGKDLSTQGTLLESRWKAARQAIDDLGTKRILFDRLVEAALLLPGNTDFASKSGRYGEILQEFLTAFPNDARSPSVKAALATNPLPLVAARAKMLDRWKQRKPKEKTELDSRLKELRDFLSENVASPDHPLMTEYEEYLASTKRRYEDDGDPDEGVIRRMSALYNSKFIKEAFTLRTDEDKTYYLPQAKKEKELTGEFGVDYLIGFNGETKRRKFSVNQILSKSTESPAQVAIATKVRSRITNLGLDEWHEFFQELTSNLINADKVDPFLRYLLILKTVEYAGRGDSVLEAELAPIRERLSNAQVDQSVAWMDPHSPQAESARQTAKEVLGQLPAIEALFTNAKARRKQLETLAFAPRFPVGWLEKDPAQGWSLQTRWKPDGEFDLFVATRPDEDGKRTWAPLGYVKLQSTRIEDSVAQSVGELSVVFALPTGMEAKLTSNP